MARCLKTLLVKSNDGSIVALLLRGDHELNTLKAEKLGAIDSPFQFASDEEIGKAAGCSAGSIGPIGLDIPMIVDRSAVTLCDFVCGTNQDDKHFRGVNWGRDLPKPKNVQDIRIVQSGDPSPNGKGVLSIARGIEVGHIFQLGTKYSKTMKANVLDENGKNQTLIMGCYGIGVTRIVAASIEQNHDNRGIIWPEAIAPFKVALLPMNMHKSERLREATEKLYQTLLDADIDVLFDDRKVRPGFMFADMELIGIPHRIVLSDSGLDDGTVEYKGRRDADSQYLTIEKIVDFLKSS